MSRMIRPLEAHSKTIGELLRFLGLPETQSEISFTGITANSREVQSGDLFIAAPGATVDSRHGAEFVESAIANGASIVMSDRAIEFTGTPVIVIEELTAMIGEISSWFYRSPSRSMSCVGITGTNGKTTTATILKQLWEADQRSTGLVGTLGIDIAGDFHSGTHTTPSAPELQAILATMSERHIRNVAMEVSSHALSLGRVSGVRFNVVAFTNLSQDHLDFHGDMDQYFAAKSKLFTQQYGDLAIINIDDAHGARLLESASLPTVSISRSNRKANWFYDSIAPESNGYRIAIRGESGILIEGFLPFLGEHNLDNALIAVSIAVIQGVDPLVVAAALPRLQSVAGRLEMIDAGQKFQAVVDFAHSPDAVIRILETLRKPAHDRGGRLIAVLGCGGDRDNSKRPLMGKALLEGSDVAIFTSDNPRSEEPNRILDEMIHGLKLRDESTIEVDRRSAIALAVATATDNDTVVVLGKGHEVGQEIAGVKYPFDDRIELASAIEALR